MYRLTRGRICDGNFETNYNDGVVADYIFENVISETDSAKALRQAVLSIGRKPVGRVVPVPAPAATWSSRNRYTRYLQVEGNDTGYHNAAPLAYAWTEIPDRMLGDDDLPLRATIGPMTSEQAVAITQSGCEDEFGVASSYGALPEGSSANGPVIISGWDFYMMLPLLGYTWQSFLVHMGHDGSVEANIEPFGFDDDSSVCGECMEVDHNDDGYTCNFRETPSGDYVGVNCGCYAAACEAEWNWNSNDADKSIALETARKVAGDGNLQFVRRYVGGSCDAYRGHFFRVEEGTGAPGEASGLCEISTPQDVLHELLVSDPDGEFIFSHDESGQFQYYFSVWRRVRDRNANSNSEVA